MWLVTLERRKPESECSCLCIIRPNHRNKKNNGGRMHLLLAISRILCIKKKKKNPMHYNGYLIYHSININLLSGSLSLHRFGISEISSSCVEKDRTLSWVVDSNRFRHVSDPIRIRLFSSLLIAMSKILHSQGILSSRSWFEDPYSLTSRLFTQKYFQTPLKQIVVRDIRNLLQNGFWFYFNY